MKQAIHNVARDSLETTKRGEKKSKHTISNTKKIQTIYTQETAPDTINNRQRQQKKSENT